MSDGASDLQLPKLLLGISAPNTPVAGYGTVAVNLPSVTAFGASSQPKLPALTLVATGFVGFEHNLNLPKISIVASGTTGTNVAVAPAKLLLPNLLVSATGKVTNLGDASLTLPIFTLSTSGFSQAQLAVPKLAITASGKTGTNATLSSDVPALLLAATGMVTNLGNASLKAPALVLLATGDNGTVGALNTALARLGITASGVNGTNGSAGLSLPSISLIASGAGKVVGTANLTLPMLSLLASGFSNSNVADNYQTLCMNTNTRGLTSYSNFAFNSMTMFNGVALAANDNGIYAMTGTLDDTAAITSNLQLGIMDYGSDKLKRIDALYFAYKTNGDLTVRITCDDTEQYEYTLESTGQDGFYTNRLKMGKGMKEARYLQIEVEGNGTQFEIDSISSTPQALSRRI